MHKLCFLYILTIPSSPCNLKERRVAINVQGMVFTLERLKIVPSYYQDLYYIQCQSIEAFKLVKSKNSSSNLSVTTIDHVGRVCIQCSSLRTSNQQSFNSLLKKSPMLVFHEPFLFVESVKSRVYSTYTLCITYRHARQYEVPSTFQLWARFAR